MIKPNIKKIKEKYQNFKDSYKYSYIGVPAGQGGLAEPYYGTYDAFKKAYPDFQVSKPLPTVLYMHGSSGLYTGDLYRRYIVEEVGALFFAPNSFKIKNRPTYQSPTTHKQYMRVHRIRQAEITYALKKLQKKAFVDSDNLFVMGNSEGGLAAAIYRSNAFRGRIITAFSCESSYFYENFSLGSSEDEPFLNIIGTDDQFFAKDTELNSHYQVKGHGIEALKAYSHAKIVILSKTKHDITPSPYVKDEIVSFLKLWIRA